MPYSIVAGKHANAATTLLEVFLTEKDELSPDFIVYDTEIRDGGFYELPEGKLIVLLLCTESPIDNYLWTTVRRYVPSKYAYYKAMRGKHVQIEINEKSGCPICE
jgi:hypothetical protein